MSPHQYSIYKTEPSLSLAFILAHELPLSHLHPSLTTLMPPTSLLCQLTPEHDHIDLPFDPVAACWSTQDLRLVASVLVCHRSLSDNSVIDGPWWAALSNLTALSWMVWGSIDYDAIRDSGESGPRWWWHGKTKETKVMDELLLVNVMRFDLRSIDHGRNFILYDL